LESLPCVTLVLALHASTLPGFAQEPLESRGPIARAVAREVARLGAPGAAGAVAVEIPADSGEKDSVLDWSRVGYLAPGTQITILLRDSPRAVRFFLANDESSLTVLTRVDASEPIVIPREQVAAIWSRPTKHVGRHAVHGAIVGAIAMATLVLLEGGHASSGAVMAGGALGTWIGALVGVALPKRADLIYRAP
jgi:hypothetical protein